MIFSSFNASTVYSNPILTSSPWQPPIFFYHNYLNVLKTHTYSFSEF